MQNKISLKKITGKAAASLILALMLTSLAGCGETSGEVSPPSVEPITTETPPDENTDAASADDEQVDVQDDEQHAENTSEANPSQGSDSGQNGGGDSAPQNDFAPQSDTELDGSVKSIGNDSFVVSQNFIMPSDSEDSLIMVAPAEGSEDEVLITVHVTEGTLYKIHTVKNGGVNGDADVEKTDGSFADIQVKNTILAQGYYENNDFWADQIIIYRFV